MSARIRHLALYTENQTGMANFYKTVFGMKRITESFNQPNHGHISDGLIGLAVLRRRPGFHSALDHFGFEVERAPLRDCVDFSGYKELDPAGVLRQGGSRSFMAPMVEHVVACLRGREVPISRGEDGMAALEVLLAIAESANARGQRIALRS